MSPDGKALVSGGEDKKLCIYDSDTYKMMTSISCEGLVTSLCFINSSIVLAGVYGSEMISVNVQTGEVIKKYDGEYAWPSIAIRARLSIMVSLYRDICIDVHVRVRTTFVLITSHSTPSQLKLM